MVSEEITKQMKSGSDVWIHRIALAAISLGYLFIVGMLGGLVLILHDGESTRETVNALTQLGQWGLIALVFIATGRPLISLIGTIKSEAISNGNATTDSQ